LSKELTNLERRRAQVKDSFGVFKKRAFSSIYSKLEKNEGKERFHKKGVQQKKNNSKFWRIAGNNERSAINIDPRQI